jgi:hypothetical protein
MSKKFPSKLRLPPPTLDIFSMNEYEKFPSKLRLPT